MRQFINAVAGLFEAIKLGKDPRFQFHLSVEPDLVPGRSFAEQTRTVSYAGARGDAGEGNGEIYTTSNLRYWITQLSYEDTGDFPENVYLVYVRDGSEGSIWSPHQDMSPPEDVIVLAKVGVIDASSDDMPDVGKMEWVAEKWLAEHGDAFLADIGEPTPNGQVLN
jgi:hypothetical protein